MKCALFPDSCSEEPEDNSLSEYELARLKRIKENKGMWQELMKDLIVSFWGTNLPTCLIYGIFLLLATTKKSEQKTGT